MVITNKGPAKNLLVIMVINNSGRIFWIVDNTKNENQFNLFSKFTYQECAGTLPSFTTIEDSASKHPKDGLTLITNTLHITKFEETLWTIKYFKGASELKFFSEDTNATKISILNSIVTHRLRNLLMEQPSSTEAANPGKI